MTEAALVPLVTLEQARDTIGRTVPRLAHVEAVLKYHPFAGFAYALHHRVFGMRRCGTVCTLVDRFTGKACISDPWPGFIHPGPVDDEAKVSDPQWNSVTFEAARKRSAQLLSTANLRRYRLSGQPRIEEVDSRKIIWKPNWLLTGVISDRTVRILVDGLTSRYYVLGT